LLNVDLIAQWMEAEGYTNIELADALHLTVRAVASMRRNGKSHGRRAVQKLANLMHSDARSLYRS
jgi:DNA-binding CsgD family transcriptional regulator